jgi:hypothetical protein
MSSVYRTSNSGAQQEIDRLGKTYNEAVARGDQASANAAHEQANRIRTALGGVAGRDYDPVSGKSLGTGGLEGRIVPGWRASMPYGNAPPAQQAVPTVPEIPSGQTAQYDPTEMINQLKEAQRRNRIAALDKAKTNALSSLNTYKTNSLASLDTQKNQGLTQLQGEQSAIAPVYYDKRNQAAAASDVGAMNFAQYAAARGIKGPAGAMPEIYRNAGLQGQIGALDQAEAAANADIERRESLLNTDYGTNVNALNQDYSQKALDINNNYDTDLVQAQADVDAQSLQNYINQMNLNRQYNLQVGQATGNINGTPTLESQKFDYSKSPSNPEVQYRISANKKLELDNAAQEIQNSYLPDTLKMQAKLLEEKVRAGSLDYDTALAQLNQIKAQTAKYLSDASSGGSGGLTAYQEANQSAKTATNNALLQVAAYGSKAEALAALQQYGPDMIAKGVDIQAVMDAINERWPY